MLPGNQSDIPCEKCQHPRTSVVGIKNDVRHSLGEGELLQREHLSTTYTHKCASPACGHRFERTVPAAGPEGAKPVASEPEENQSQGGVRQGELEC